MFSITWFWPRLTDSCSGLCLPLLPPRAVLCEGGGAGAGPGAGRGSEQGTSSSCGYCAA